MFCDCSGEQFQFEEAPQSPDSLATRDFSVSGFSSRTAGRESRFDDNRLDDVESTLKEALSLNYEEARALLGRLEYQRGNYDAALQVLQGIDVQGLKPRMTKALIWRMKRGTTRQRGEVLQLNVMSLHSVSLLLEAMLLKSKTLEALTRNKEAAMACASVFDVVEATWPNGLPAGMKDDCKLLETFHKAVELLPKLWKKAGILEEAITSYRKALTKPWNLDPRRLAELQKDLAIVLLYGGCESSLSSTWDSATPEKNLEEAILLLSLIFRKAVNQEIAWDPEIMELLGFALSMADLCGCIARHLEEILPGFYDRGERWYLLALCYSSAGQDEVALNLLRKAFDHFEKKNRKHLLRSLLFAMKLCSRNIGHANEGIKLAKRALMCSKHEDEHFIGVINHLLGICYNQCSRISTSDLQRQSLQKRCLDALDCAAAADNYDPEVMFTICLVEVMQRNMKNALENAIKYCELVAGSSVKGWKLLALALSAEQKYHEAESIIDLALDETGTTDQLELLRLKAELQNLQDQPKNSIESYKKLLAVFHSCRDLKSESTEIATAKNFEMEAWLDVADVYMNLGLLSDAEISLNKAKSIGCYSPRSWYVTGKLLEARSLHGDALVAFFTSLSIDADYVPSMVSTAATLAKLNRSSFRPIARSFLLNALRLEPMDHEAWMNLGLVLKEEGLPLQAADCFQAAYELKQSSPAQNITRIPF